MVAAAAAATMIRMTRSQKAKSDFVIIQGKLDAARWSFCNARETFQCIFVVVRMFGESFDRTQTVRVTKTKLTGQSARLREGSTIHDSKRRAAGCQLALALFAESTTEPRRLSGDRAFGSYDDAAAELSQPVDQPGSQ